MPTPRYTYRFMNMRNAAVLVASVLCLAAVSPGPDAQRAKKRYDTAVEKAREKYEGEVRDARAQLTRELDAVLKAAMKAGNLDRANAIRAMMEKAKNEEESLTEVLIEGEWVHQSGSRGRYRKNGIVRFDAWGRDGQWKQIDANTIRQVEGGGMGTTITFSSDRQRAFWVFDNGGVNWARRAEKD